MSGKGDPARFLMRNSKGYPDFVMTMLVFVILTLLLAILVWFGFNVLAFRNLDPQQAAQYSEFIKSFNDNARLIILGICSSVFTLAGTYYLRRASHDRYYAGREKSFLEATVSKVGGFVQGFVDKDKSTLDHPNYDDEEEDI